MVREMSGRRNILEGKCPVGRIVLSGDCPIGKVSVEDLPSGYCQSGN